MNYYSNYLNPNLQNYGSPTYYQPQYAAAPQQAQPVTNKLYVTSAEDALSRFTNPNTITVFFLQDESTIFEVVTDAQGKKNIRARKLVDISEEPKKQSVTGDFVTRAEFEDFRTKLEKSMTASTKSKKKGEADDDE